MKTLKFTHAAAQAIQAGVRNFTWRLGDDKNLTVNDRVECIDKVEPNQPRTWRAIGVAIIDRIDERRLEDLTDDELRLLDADSRSTLLTMTNEYYGNQATGEAPVKIIRFSFEPYSVAKDAASQSGYPKQVKLFADGGSRGNPGPSASGYVLLDMADNVVKSNGVYLGITTNNQAEYQALRFGLEAAHKIGARDVSVYLDSMLVVNQMKGIFKVKNRDLWPVHQAIKEQVELFAKVTFMHVPRELNKLADAEVNETLNAVLGEN